MTNGDKIRMMSDQELSEFMRQCEREEVKYYQHNCKECINRACEDCRIKWLSTDECKEKPEIYDVILETVEVLFPTESTYHRATLAGEVYRALRRKNEN